MFGKFYLPTVIELSFAQQNYGTKLWPTMNTNRYMHLKTVKRGDMDALRHGHCDKWGGMD